MADATVFLDVGFRLAAAAVGISFGRSAWSGLVERKIKPFNPDVINWILSWWVPNQVLQRDVTPVRYWMEIGFQSFSSIVCLVGAVIGRWHPHG
jgi:hypothetical protein